MFHLALHGHTSIVFVIAVVCLLLSGWGLVKMDLKGIGWPPDSQLSAVALCGGGFFAHPETVVFLPPSLLFLVASSCEAWGLGLLAPTHPAPQPTSRCV